MPYTVQSFYYHTKSLAVCQPETHIEKASYHTSFILYEKKSMKHLKA